MEDHRQSAATNWFPLVLKNLKHGRIRAKVSVLTNSKFPFFSEVNPTDLTKTFKIYII